MKFTKVILLETSLLDDEEAAQEHALSKVQEGMQSILNDVVAKGMIRDHTYHWTEKERGHYVRNRMIMGLPVELTLEVHVFTEEELKELISNERESAVDEFRDISL